jgi:hypothetical protein
MAIFWVMIADPKNTGVYFSKGTIEGNFLRLEILKVCD